MPSTGGRADDRPALAATADLLGTKWTALIVHDLSEGPRGFCEIQRACGVGPRTLDDRLARLVDGGYVLREACGQRRRYELTERGLALLPIIDAMRAFGHTWLVGDPVHRAARHDGGGSGSGPAASAPACGSTAGRTTPAGSGPRAATCRIRPAPAPAGATTADCAGGARAGAAARPRGGKDHARVGSHAPPATHLGS